MENLVKNFGEVEAILGKSIEAFVIIVGNIRINYIMDEYFDGKNELKFRRSGKTLVTIYLKDGMFTVLVIFGKEERIKFENDHKKFSKYINDHYKNSKTYHDGKWMFIDISDNKYIDDIIELIRIKKKPNRKKEDLTKANISKCGNRCDLCLLFIENNNNGKQGRFEFQERDFKCYGGEEGDKKEEHPSHICNGCRSNCEILICLSKKGFDSCMDCDYHNCNVKEHNFTNPGRCNIGLSAEDVEKMILPYWGKERFDQMKL